MDADGGVEAAGGVVEAAAATGLAAVGGPGVDDELGCGDACPEVAGVAPGAPLSVDDRPHAVAATTASVAISAIATA